MKKISIVLLAMLFVLSIAVAASATQVYVDSVTQATGCLDVNKTWIDDGLLCWAASASNILAYTGWIGAPNLSTTNQIFDDFKAYWTNDLGNVSNAILWWFTGVNELRFFSDMAQLTNYTHPGFYTRPLFDDNIRSAVLDSDFEATMSDYVNGDVGISLKITWDTFSHYLTLWGIDTETDQIFVTDSDDSEIVLKTYTYDPTTRQLNYREGRSTLMMSITGLELWGAGDPGPTPRQGSEVPEPTTMLLLGSGLIGLAGLRRCWKE